MSFAPVNSNFLQSNGYVVTFERSPEVSFFAYAVTVPEMSINNPRRATPFVEIPEPGDHIQYGQMLLQFQMDEELKTWESIYNWMLQIGFPEAYEQFAAGLVDPLGDSPGTVKNLTSDITVTVLDNHKRPKVKFTFHDCIPASLSNLEFDLNGDTEPMIISAAFDYSFYTMSRNVA